MTAASPPPRQAAAHAACTPAQKRWVLVACILGSSLAFVDGTIVNVALPAIQRTLHASLYQAQWVVEAYALLLGALLLVRESREGGNLHALFLTEQLDAMRRYGVSPFCLIRCCFGGRPLASADQPRHSAWRQSMRLTGSATGTQHTATLWRQPDQLLIDIAICTISVPLFAAQLWRYRSPTATKGLGHVRDFPVEVRVLIEAEPPDPKYFA